MFLITITLNCLFSCFCSDHTNKLTFCLNLDPVIFSSLSIILWSNLSTLYLLGCKRVWNRSWYLSCELSSTCLKSRHKLDQNKLLFFFSYLAFLEQSVDNLQSPASKGYTTSNDYQPRQSFVPHWERQWNSLLQKNSKWPSKSTQQSSSQTPSLFAGVGQWSASRVQKII